MSSIHLPSSILAVNFFRETEIGRLLAGVNAAGGNVRHLMNMMRDTPHARFIAQTAQFAQDARAIIHSAHPENSK